MFMSKKTAIGPSPEKSIPPFPLPPEKEDDRIPVPPSDIVPDPLELPSDEPAVPIDETPKKPTIYV